MLREATQQTAASLVVVTHDEQVAAWCSRTIRMRDGLIVGPDGGAQQGYQPTAVVGQVPPPVQTPAGA